MAKKRGKIEISNFGGALEQLLEEYGYICNTVVDRAIKKTAEETAEVVAANAPSRTGNYKTTIDTKDATAKKAAKTGRMTTVVYAQYGGYQLAHLLENGHARVGGGRDVPPSPKGGHWAPAEKQAQERVVENFKAELRSAT